MGLKESEERQTTRLAAFSDGVFAVAITLLVIDLKAPDPSGTEPLFQGLLALWPSYLAFVTSFMTILIMWMNHHNLVNFISRIDRRFMLFNGLLLLLVTLTPFTTLLVSEHILLDDAQTAATVYSGGFFLLAVAFNLLWRYASSGRRLLGRSVTESQIRGITRQYYVGPMSYTVAILVSLVSGVASVLIILLVMAFYAVTATISQ